jgi:hypothetical protein
LADRELLPRYYGEKVAMYYAFLDFYNRAIILPAIFGAFTMIGHGSKGVEGNPVTVFYSVAVAAWAIAFLALWRRREAELAFMWGRDGASSHLDERVRVEFLHHDLCSKVVNEITKKEEFVYTHRPTRCFRFGVGWLVVLLGVALVIFGCYVAMYIKVLDDVHIGDSIYIVGEVKYADLLGSLTSVAITITFGLAFDFFVGPMLTNWEGHKTTSSFENALIFKAICFQIANNYL